MSVDNPENNVVKFPKERIERDESLIRIGTTQELCEWIDGLSDAIIIGFDHHDQISIASKKETDLELMDSLIYALRYVHARMEDEVNKEGGGPV